MMAMAQGGPVAISYAVRHTDRVSRLMFYDSYANRLHGMAADDIELEDDVSHLLPQLSIPTQVLHALGDRMNSFEHGRHVASSIRGARFVALESQNHSLLEDEPAWPIFLDEVEHFLDPDPWIPSSRSTGPRGLLVTMTSWRQTSSASWVARSWTPRASRPARASSMSRPDPATTLAS